MADGVYWEVGDLADYIEEEYEEEDDEGRPSD